MKHEGRKYKQELLLAIFHILHQIFGTLKESLEVFLENQIGN